MSPPLDFEDAREAMAWEPIERELEAMMVRYRHQKRLIIIREYRAWEKHWRTRLFFLLHRLADKIRIDKPIPPNPSWRELR